MILEWLDKKKQTLAIQGDINTLIRLDDLGLFLAPDESLETYGERLKTIAQYLDRINTAFKMGKTVEIFDTHFHHKSHIPIKAFKESKNITVPLYRFSIDWVPAFFSNRYIGILAAGAAFYSRTPYTVLFLIRKSFAIKKKWIIYTREELIAHELCHVARMAHHSEIFEEVFSYQTASTAFRRICGGIIRKHSDNYLIIAALFILVIAQCIITLLPIPLYQRLGFIGVSIAIGILAWIGIRYIWVWYCFTKAKRNISYWVKSKDVMALLFRCSDTEIIKLASLSNSVAVKDWLEKQYRHSIRWKVICSKFTLSLNRKEPYSSDKELILE